MIGNNIYPISNEMNGAFKWPEDKNGKNKNYDVTQTLLQILLATRYVPSSRNYRQKYSTWKLHSSTY